MNKDFQKYGYTFSEGVPYIQTEGMIKRSSLKRMFSYPHILHPIFSTDEDIA